MNQALQCSNQYKLPALLLVAALFAMAAPARAQKGNAASGQKLFEEKCEKCHDKDGSGGTVIGKALQAADLRSPVAQKLSDAEIYAQIDKGKGNMPPFGGSLNKSQFNDLIAFVRQLAKNGKKR